MLVGRCKGHASPDSVKTTRKSRIVKTIIEADLLQFEESATCEQAVTTCLMLNTDSFNAQVVGNILEATLQVLATLHQKFDVIEAGEENVEKLKKFSFLGRKDSASQNFQEVTEIVPGMK